MTQTQFGLSNMLAKFSKDTDPVQAIQEAVTWVMAMAHIEMCGDAEEVKAAKFLKERLGKAMDRVAEEAGMSKPPDPPEVYRPDLEKLVGKEEG